MLSYYMRIYYTIHLALFFLLIVSRYIIYSFVYKVVKYLEVLLRVNIGAIFLKLVLIKTIINLIVSNFMIIYKHSYYMKTHGNTLNLSFEIFSYYIRIHDNILN